MEATVRNLSLLPEPQVRTRRAGAPRHPDVAAQLTVRSLRLALDEAADPAHHAAALARLAGGDRSAILRAIHRVDGADDGVDARARTLLVRALDRLESEALAKRRPA